MTAAILGGLFSHANAQNLNADKQTLILSDNFQEHYLSPYLTKYKDVDNNINIKDIVSAMFLTGEKSSRTGSVVTLRTSGNNVWLSFDVMNRSTSTKWKVDFGNSFMGRFGLFDFIEAYSYNFTTNELVRKDINDDGQITLNVPRNQKSQIVLHLFYKKGLPTAVPLRIVNSDKLTGKENSLLKALFTFLFVGMAAFFVAVAFLRQQNEYLFFTLYYALLFILLNLQNAFVVSPVPVLGSALIPFLFLSTSFAGLMTTKIFWAQETQTENVKKIFLGSILFATILFFTNLFLPLESDVAKYSLYYMPALLIIAVIPLLSLLQQRTEHDEIITFMLGWLILLFGTCITILSLAQIIPDVSSAINSLWYTLLPQAFFFLIATKAKLESDGQSIKLSQTLEIDETETVTRLRESKENTEQERLLKVIEQERKVLGELRKSEARRAEEMRKAKEDADTANKAKSAFLAVVSHEIRTPMTGIMGMIKLLLDSNLTKEQKEYVQTVQDSSDAMLALLNDILDFEKIEQGKMAFENISFDLHRLINGVTTLMNGHAVQKNIELKTKIGDTLPQYVYGDPTRLRQVLLNLTGNAIKFTSEGSVTLAIELMRRKEDDMGEIYFGITDTGVGISKEAQKDLFSPFSQADKSISRKFGGTGLGLAISKGLVEGMGSTININSNQGEGSTFFFTLTMPLSDSDQVDAQYMPKNMQAAIKAQKILVVDDNKINQKVIEGFLEKTPHKLTMIDSAQIAINRLEKESFDLILMDIEMPNLKGDEATKLIRQSDNEKIKNIPIIALTGNTMPSDIESYYDAGMNGVIAKPIDIDLLKSTINKAGQNIFDNALRVKATPPPADEEKQSSDTPKTKKIIAARAQVSQNKVTPKPEPIASQPVDKVTTAEEKKNTQPLSFDDGALNPETLNTLKTHLQLHDIQEMLDDVVKKNDDIITAMRAALADGKNAELSARAHEMKGMAGNFGLMELSEQAGKIEAKAKLDEAPLTLTALLEPLPEMQKRAKEALNQWIQDNQD